MHIEIRTALDEQVLGDVLDLITAATKVDGHRPVGEHKHAHLAVGARDWTGVLSYEGGRLAGYAHLRWNPEGDRPRLAVEVAVHPDHRDPEGTVARRVLDEAQRVLAQAGGGRMYLWVHRVEDPRETLAARIGFDVQRELAFMTRRLDEPVDGPPAPPGVALRGYRPGADDEELLRVNNAAFVGHPENGGWDLAELRRRHRRAWFDPEGLLTAWRGERLVGFHWTKWHGHESDEVPAHEPVGEVYVLAVDPAEAGTGIGRWLLAAGLAYLSGKGCRIAVLYVDMASERAVALYRRAGFEIEYREVCYERLVAPADDRDEDLSRPF